MKKSITKDEYFQLAGLFHLAQQTNTELNKYSRAMENLIGVKERWGSLLTDRVLEPDETLDQCLKDMEVKVDKK